MELKKWEIKNQETDVMGDIRDRKTKTEGKTITEN